MILRDVLKLVSNEECVVIINENNIILSSYINWTYHLDELEGYLDKEIIRVFSSTRCPIRAETGVPMRTSVINFKIRSL